MGTTTQNNPTIMQQAIPTIGEARRGFPDAAIEEQRKGSPHAAMEKLRNAAIEKLRDRFRDAGLWPNWHRGDRRCCLFLAPADLWARGVVCPPESTFMLWIVSKRMRKYLQQIKGRVPALMRCATTLGFSSKVLQAQRQTFAEITGINMAKIGLSASNIVVLEQLLSSVKKLETLDLSDNELYDASIVALAPTLSKCEQLRELHVRKNFIGTKGASALANAVAESSAIQVLDLTGNFMDTEPKISWNITSLLHLNLGSNLIRNTSTFRKMVNLVTLDISENQIVSEAAFELATIVPTFHRLQTLDVSDNHVRHPAALALVNALLKNETAVLLNLHQNLIDEQSQNELRCLVASTAPKTLVLVV